MRQKIVFIIENESGVRTTYETELKQRGFDVYSAETVKDARFYIKELGEKIDVALLDMKLETDPDEPGTSGAELGLELKSKCINITPEFLIRSGFSEVAYFKSALELGAAAYLAKTDTRIDDVVRHVRALLLRHYLKVENPTVIEELNRIAATTKNITDSIRSFCEHILAPAFEDCLGAPFMLLLTDENETQNIAGSADMPLTPERMYHTLQAMTHANADPAVPYEFNAAHFQTEMARSQDNFMIKQLEGSAFISLASVNNYRLSLGILKAPPKQAFPEDPLKLASLVSRYVRSTVCENFIKILVHIDTKRKTTLGSTSQLCLFLGQEQTTIADEGVSTGELVKGSTTHLRLQSMADDLQETGVILTNVAQSLDRSEMTRVQMTSLIMDAWEDLRDAWQLSDIKFNLDGECSVYADQDDLYIIVARVLQWLAQRRAATEPPFQPTIIVHCESDDRSARLIFEDRSKRLLANLRERLFEPFTLAAPSARGLAAARQSAEAEISVEDIKASARRPGYLPLYLAKTLVEEKYHGWFEDKSDEMEGEVGHRLVMQLHRAFEPEAIPARR